MSVLIKNCEIILEQNSVGGDVLIEDGVIKMVSRNYNSDVSVDKIIDGTGLALMTGFVDMHCHLREPGFEYKEDIMSGSSAAVAGGFTTICCMPNTKPTIDNKVVIDFIKNVASTVNLAKVFPIGAITKGLKGEELAEIQMMKENGAIAFSDDGCPVSNANLMRLAMEYANGCNALLISHSEDKSLANGGSVNEGVNSTISGLKGITRAAEEVMIAREIILAETFGARIHIAHVSTKGSVQLIREAKARGVKITAETCPHYVAGTDNMILDYNPDAKVNPPLRTQEDVEAIVAGLIDGTIDVIATDHAPHHLDDKNVEFQNAAFGISGFETAFALCYTNLVKTGKITLPKLVNLMAARPAEILGLDPKIIYKGKVADLVLVDLNAKYTIDKTTFKSKGKNTPFNMKQVYGKVVATFVNGDIKYYNGEIIR